MSPTFATQTFVELVIAGLLIYGFMHEDKVVWFEQNVKRIVIGHYRRTRRILLYKKAIVKAERLRGNKK